MIKKVISRIKNCPGEFVGLIINLISVFALLTAYSTSICRYFINGSTVEIKMFSALTSGNVLVFATLISYTLLFILAVLLFLPVIRSYISGSVKFVSKSKCSVYFNFVLALAFSLAGVIFFFIDSKNGLQNEVSSLFPAELEAVLTVLHALAISILPENSVAKKKTTAIPTIISALFVLVFSGIALVSCFMNIADIRFSAVGFEQNVIINGKNLLLHPGNYPAQLQLISYILFASLVTLAVLTVVSLVGILSRNKSAQSVATFTVGLAFVIVLALGIFGKYYQIAIKMNVESFVSIYEQFGGTSLPDNYTISVKSSVFYLIIVDTALAIALILSKVFTRLNREIEKYERLVVDGEVAEAKASFRTENTTNIEDCFAGEMLDDTAVVETNTEEAPGGNVPVMSQEQLENTEEVAKGNVVGETAAPVLALFDNCPSFTELDDTRKKLAAEQTKNKATSQKFTLSSLSEFVVKYAAESRNHLSYKKEDIAVFLAGLGMSRLTILQGLSGTGKTSLPKIFTEAVLGKCEIVEVESSWKDKNELLGYFNEFSKVYSPKKFTRALYSAALCDDTVFFIVLDEMNLSRIEYYFSDFLSLMENDEDKREIRLLDHKIYNTVEGKKKSYSALKGDNTLKIPTNVWFIGTANRDESTFEISDKVYDRANTINFNKRASKAVYSGTNVPEVFLSKSDLVALFNDAISGFDFDIEKYNKLFDVEKLLEPYNITFGNRVLRQMESFVKVYCSCFEDKYSKIDEAMEKIMLSKLVSKLEFKNIRDKETLVRSFEKLRLYECSAFVNSVGGYSFYD